MSMLGNRIRKNFRHRKKWARREALSCFRVYDHDIPEFPLSVDYLDGAAALRFGRSFEPGLGLKEEIASALSIEANRVFWSGTEQHSMEVEEGGHRFVLHLGRAFDYGLFLDHRNLRRVVQEESGGLRFLNLFCYTASFSVYASGGLAESSVSVDLSKSNLAWAQENFSLNGLSDKHELVQADALEYLKDCRQEFDLIVCDPPTFSNSKRSERDFDVQKVHLELLELCLGRLSRGGRLYFSNNARKFRLAEELSSCAKEITQETIPEDYKRRPSHRCWLIEKL